MAKIDNIADLKEAKQVAPESLQLDKEKVEAYYSKMIKDDRRREVAEQIMNYVNEKEMGFEEFLLGVSDWVSGVLLGVTASNRSEEEFRESMKNQEKLRTALATALNQTRECTMSDDISVLSSLLGQSVIIVAEKTLVDLNPEVYKVKADKVETAGE